MNRTWEKTPRYTNHTWEKTSRRGSLGSLNVPWLCGAVGIGASAAHKAIWWDLRLASLVYISHWNETS